MSVLPPLRIRVRLFAMQRETAGTKELRLEVPLGATVDDAWSAVVAVVPALAPGRSSLRFAVNGEYTDPDRPLADGDEVACIPPVSGGSGEDESLPDAPRRILEIRVEPFGSELAAELANRLATDEDGGVVAFLGRTRVTPGTPAPGQEAEAGRHAGREVQGLEYEAFEPMALTVLAEIADEIEARFGVRRVGIIHRTGHVPLGDTSVLVVAVAPHRDAAFAAARYAIDETKARAPIWKAEHFTDGAVWIGQVARTGPGDAPEA
ncbi:MAG TPA: molybdenum cofactor biosynthesis protein MoaE [Candidatus Limnocylindrales bacterium]|nr:molybdenum cofactor biosynthesis protein MoaE [Candidatus Limnocylindrales bacterium]